MIFHENRLQADDSHKISYLIFFFKLGKMSQNLSSAAVLIDALRVNCCKTTGKTENAASHPGLQCLLTSHNQSTAAK